MRDYLVFQLAGPMSSWGDIAIGESRFTHRSPTRSAVIGMLGAALRIRRDDTRRLASLQEAVGMATLTLSKGSIARDYHTSQVPPATALKGRRTVTRRDELMELIRHSRDAGSSSGTILSSREYLCDAAWLVTVWLRRDDELSLEDLQRALRRPGFVPYLGRKCCPVMLPVGARIIAADSIRTALHRWWSGRPMPSIAEVVPAKGTTPFPLEWDPDGVAGVPERSRAQRRDVPANRAQWQFLNRLVCKGECALEESP